jgi:hypothetical protein
MRVNELEEQLNQLGGKLSKAMKLMQAACPSSQIENKDSTAQSHTSAVKVVD